MHYGPVRVKLKSSLILVVYLCILVEIVAIPVKKSRFNDEPQRKDNLKQFFLNIDK